MDDQKIHVAPKKMEDVYENIHFDEALSVADPRYVETARGRGDDYLKDLAGFFNVNMDAEAFRGNPPKYVSAMLCGHRGCGKSTELNRFAEQLDKENLFFVVKIDAFQELNPNDVQFVDVFMALAKKLFFVLKEIGVDIPEIYLENLEKWFFQRIVIEDNKQGTIKVYLRYTEEGTSVIEDLQKVSTPGLRQYIPNKQLKSVMGGIGVAIYSTSKGLLTDKEVGEQGIGGELICKIW